MRRLLVAAGCLLLLSFPLLAFLPSPPHQNVPSPPEGPPAHRPAPVAGPAWEQAEASFNRHPPRTLLTRVKDVRALTVHQAKQAHPVRLHGTVTYYDPDWLLLFIQDATAGIFVNSQALGILPLQPGQLVEVEGFSGPGDFAPVVMATAIHVRSRSGLPQAPSTSLERMFSGQEDSQWVEAEGIIRSVTEREGHAEMKMASGPYEFSLALPGLEEHTPPAHLVDAKVRVRGVCATIFNQKRQLVGIRLFVPDLDYIQVQVPSRADPYSIPVRPIESLLQFSPEETTGHRIRVQGVVTLQQPSGDLFIQDDTGGLYVQTQQKRSARPGDRVDVIGFATMGTYTPILQDATFRRVGTSPLPAPLVMTAAEVLEGRYDAHLVRLEAHLLDQMRSRDEQVLTLQAGHLIFNAHLAQAPQKAPLSLRNGSLLQLTGVWFAGSAAQTGAFVLPGSPRLLLPSAEDIAVVKRAPWWTRTHTLGLLGLMAAVLLVSLGWVVLLRRRVDAQTRLIRQKLNEEASLKEAAQAASKAKSHFLSVISHELRTPLASIFGYVQILREELRHRIAPHEQEFLDIVRSSTEALLRLVDELLNLEMVESGRLNLDVRTVQVDEIVEDVAGQLYPLAAEKGLTLRVIHAAEDGAVRADAMRLRQVILNLVSNAIKYTDQGGISVHIERAALPGPGSLPHPAVSVAVQDTGAGISRAFIPHLFEPFTQEQQTYRDSSRGIGLGLALSHELITRMGGTIHVESEVEVGSTFTLVLPAPASPDEPVASSSTAFVERGV